MEIAALVCNDKLNYESAFQIYSLYEYLKHKNNQVQIIDYNLLDRNKKSFSQKKKNELLYNFLDDNVVMTSIRYKTIEQIEDNPPLADKYIISNATYHDLNMETLNENYYAYAIKDIGADQLNNIKDKYKKVSTLFDIKGEVVSPGVYSIECDKRVIDAIDKSGGLTKNSDTSVLNLSKKIEDGMVIIVYSKKEVSNYLKTLEEESKKNSICSSSNVVNGACIDNNNVSNSNLVNINTASLNELMTLSGVGESKAKNIISYRENTPFKTIEDILNVDGIGESIYVKIKENITV